MGGHFEAIMADEFANYCSYCKTRKRFRSEGVNHILHLLITLFLCGLWAPVWLAICMFDKGEAICTECGSVAR